MENQERAIHWRPRPDLSLAERISHFAEGALALKEIEFLGRTCAGPLPPRLADLMDFILNFLEVRHGVRAAGVTVPERVKAVRQQIITRLSELPAADPLRRQGEQDLEDVFPRRSCPRRTSSAKTAQETKPPIPVQGAASWLSWVGIAAAAMTQTFLSGPAQLSYGQIFWACGVVAALAGTFVAWSRPRAVPEMLARWATC